MSSRQEFVSEQPLTHNPTPDAEMTASHKKKSRGKGAKAKSTATFVTKSNQKHTAQQREAALKRLGVFNQDAAQLEQSLKSMMVTIQPRAIPLPIATRGIGFTTVAEYSAAPGIKTQSQIYICTIYQYYRVSLFLLAFKVYHARYVQQQEESFPLSTRFMMNEEYRQELQTVSQVPISMYNIICTVGTIQGETAFNSYFPDQGLDYGQDAALYLNLFNIRTAVEGLCDPATQQQHRQFL